MMKNINHIFLFLLLFSMSNILSAQQDLECNPTSGLPVDKGEAIMVYGATMSATSFNNSMNITVGQPIVGQTRNASKIIESGFWASFIMPPQAPIVVASQGDFADRNLISWSTNALSSTASGGFDLYRDGVYLANTTADVQEYMDFNVQAGELYEYSVVAKNTIGRSTPGYDIGFVNPNGVIQGRVTTRNGNPVPDCIVTVSPTNGQSLAFDGIDDYLCVSYDASLNTSAFTFSTWLKVDNYNNGAIIDLGSSDNDNWWVRTDMTNSSLTIGIGDGTNSSELNVTLGATPADWHHFAAVYNGQAVSVYIDGEYKGAMVATMNHEPSLFSIGADFDNINYFEGNLDDTRIYNRALTQTEIILGKDITADVFTNGLVAYWKFDEGQGRNAFDIKDTFDAEINGATFSSDTPDILNAAVTDVNGDYIIQGINYSQNGNLTVTPMKSFYKNYSLEFQAANQSYAELAAFDLPDTNSVEIAFLPFDTESKQVILTNGEGTNANFQFYIENNNYYLTINGTTTAVGTPSGQFEHFVITTNSGTSDVSIYQNGVPYTGSYNYGTLSGNWSLDTWYVGAEDDAGFTNFYTGLVDKIVFYEKDFVQSNVQILATNNPNPSQAFIDSDTTRNFLYADYGFNEASGNELDDFGPNIFSKNTMEQYVSFHHNATYSIVARVQDETPHEFEPNSKNVVLNYSSTSVSNINFTDISTVSISGVIRYDDTFCYGDSLIEILVNGESAFPPIFLNENGRFVGDFEPGSNIKLSPVYEDHEFSPAFIEVRRLNVPVANALFLDQTKREVTGQVFGGLCRNSIIKMNADGTPNYIVKVKARSQNGCYETEQQLVTPDGKFTFTDLPPVAMTFSVIEHSDVNIYTYFQGQGGPVLDLRAIEKDTVDFMYVSGPNIEIADATGHVTQDSCSNTYLRQSKKETDLVINTIRVYEEYLTEKCYLDMFDLDIANNFEGSTFEASSDSTHYDYGYYVNNVNTLTPYTNNFTVTANVNGASTSETYTGIALGDRKLSSTFTTSSPEHVFAILHDPPGDASSATWARGTELCFSMTLGSFEGGTTSDEIGADFGDTKKFYAGTPGAGTIDEVGFKNEKAVNTEVTVSTEKESTAQFCNELEIEISTDDGDDIWGEDADVVYGASINFEMGASERLTLNGCVIEKDERVTVDPKGYDTEFFYSIWQIKTVIVPYLESTGQVQDSISAVRWNALIAQNKARRASFDEVYNYSFDAAASVTLTESSSKGLATSLITTVENNIDVTQTLGVVGVANDAYYTQSSTITFGDTQGFENEETTTTTTSFTLADDDLNDFYSVDIANDPVYGTPIFRLKGGESMCPWIPGTRNREEVAIFVDRNTANNVPSNTEATFILTLGNIGPNGVDGLVFELGVEEDGNPDGAIIKVDGQPLISPIQFQFVGEESITKTLTVAKPAGLQFDFEDLGLYFGSACQIEHSESVGYDAGDENGGFLIYQEFADPSNSGTGEDFYKRLFKNIDLDVYFIEPCSPVDIAFPLQGHVVTPAAQLPNGDLPLNITISEYQNNDPDLELIRVQYRPIPGDGSWINITEIPVADLATDPVSKIIQWEMGELRDGNYQIRALTQCYDVTLDPGMSTFINITKETEAPELFGTPEPADGTLTVGDEISITFNEGINCNKVFDADGIGTNINLNNIALINTETGALVPFSHQCVDDKIVITPEVQSQFIDGKILKAVATNVEDLAGNPMAVPVGAPGSPTVNFKEWEFLVDLNPLRWEDGSNIAEVKTEGLIKVVTRNIINNSGTSMNYTITGKRLDNLDGSVSYENIPSWMLIDPKVGTLEAGEIKTITFVFPQDLLVDDYLTNINVVGSQGDNDIEVDLKVRCPGPEWDFDRVNDFENTMTFTVQVDVFGEITVDNSDRVAAFINGELRGSAYIEKVEAFDGIDNNGDGLTNDDDIEGQYMAFLTVYGDETDDPIIDFNFFDGSECIVYSEVIEQIAYQPTAQEGTPTTPTVLHLVNVVDRKIPLAQGWTWISVNLDLTDNSTDNVLNILDNKDGDLIKDDNTFAQYLSGTWVGSMSDIGFEKRYMYYTPEQDTLCLTGMPYDPTTSTIPITNGWNWIGFVPQQGMSVDNALASLTPLNGDLVKSQIAFAQYITGFGWIGNLNVMQAPNGYLLNISNAGTLEYDPTLQARDVSVLEKREPTTPYWDVNSSLYQHNMNITAIIDPADYQLEENDQIGVFANGELRGYGEAIYVEPLKEHFLFVTAYGDEVTEDLDFILFSQRDSSLTNLNEIISFSPDKIIGTALEPFVFNIGAPTATTELETELSVSIYPNPSRYEFNIEFNSTETQALTVQLLNVQGQIIETLDVDVPVGQHTLQYDARALPNGVYNMTISGKDIQIQKKLIKIN